MSLFCIIGFDEVNTFERREKYKDAHLKYLQSLNREGRLLAAGPLIASQEPNATACGSMFIVDFENQSAAEEWFKNDAYYQAGIYQTLHIKPYIDAMPYC
jgi:uncharacterized protein YciI